MERLTEKKSYYTGRQSSYHSNTLEAESMEESTVESDAERAERAY